MSKHPWVKWYPSDFLNGIAEMEPNEIAVYTIILNRIFDENGPIQDDHKKIARRCNMRPTTCEKVLTRLAESGKIERHGGSISNERAQKCIKSRSKVSQKLTSAAHKRWSKVDEKQQESADVSMPRHAEGIEKQKPLLLEARSQKLDNRDPTDLCRKSRIPYTKEFESFWKPFPTDPNMSKKEAFTQWKKLSPEDRQKAVQSISGFNAYCAERPDYRPVHACRYLSQRRFDGFIDGNADTMEELRRRMEA